MSKLQELTTSFNGLFCDKKEYALPRMPHLLESSGGTSCHRVTQTVCVVERTSSEKMRGALLFLMTIIISMVSGQSNRAPCTFTDPNGVNYDLTALTGQGTGLK